MHRTLTQCRRLLEQSGTPEAQQKGPQRRRLPQRSETEKRLRSALQGYGAARRSSGVGSALSYQLSAISYHLPSTDYQLSAFKTLRLPCQITGIFGLVEKQPCGKIIKMKLLLSILSGFSSWRPSHQESQHEPGIWEI